MPLGVQCESRNENDSSRVSRPPRAQFRNDSSVSFVLPSSNLRNCTALDTANNGSIAASSRCAALGRISASSCVRFAASSRTADARSPRVIVTA
ncbi:MAG: hypothetical protein ACO1OB_17085, partial [Archangium sp.]